MDSYPSLQDIPIQTPVLLDGGIGTGLTKYGYNTDTPLVKFAVENPVVDKIEDTLRETLEQIQENMFNECKNRMIER